MLTKTEATGSYSEEEEALRSSEISARSKLEKAKTKEKGEDSSDIAKRVLIKKELSNRCKAQKRKILLYKQKLAFYEGRSH